MLRRSLSSNSLPLVLNPAVIVSELLGSKPSSFHLGEYTQNPKEIRLIPREELYVISANVSLSRLRIQMETIIESRERQLKTADLAQIELILNNSNSALYNVISDYVTNVTNELKHLCDESHNYKGALAYVDSWEDANMIYQYFRARNTFVAIEIVDNDKLLDNYGNYPYHMAFSKYPFDKKTK